MYEQQEKNMLRRLRYAAVALKTQMPDQKRWTGVLKKCNKKKEIAIFWKWIPHIAVDTAIWKKR